MGFPPARGRWEGGASLGCGASAYAVTGRHPVAPWFCHWSVGREGCHAALVREFACTSRSGTRSVCGDADGSPGAGAGAANPRKNLHKITRLRLEPPRMEMKVLVREGSGEGEFQPVLQQLPWQPIIPCQITTVYSPSEGKARFVLSPQAPEPLHGRLCPSAATAFGR